MIVFNFNPHKSAIFIKSKNYTREKKKIPMPPTVLYNTGNLKTFQFENITVHTDNGDVFTAIILDFHFKPRVENKIIEFDSEYPFIKAQ